jgi:uncharacterized protein (TIGR02271 family)
VSGHTKNILTETKDLIMAYEVQSNPGGVVTATQVVVGLFKNAIDAHQALTELRAQGFNSSQIGAAFRSRASDSYLDPSDAGAVSTETVRREHENWWDKVKDAFRSDDSVERRRESRDAAAAGTSFEPELYSRGDYEYDLADDDFEGSLAGTGIPADRASYLTRSLEPGGAIVTVHDANRVAEAEQILAANNARVRYEDLAQDEVIGNRAVETDEDQIDTADSTGQEITDTGYVDRRPVGNLDRADDLDQIDAADSTRREIADTGYLDRRPVGDANRVDDADPRVERVQLFGEVLRVHKERISRGEVRVRKDVVTENQTIEVPVTREELVVERVAVSGDTPAPSGGIGSGQEIRIPLSEDKVRLEKEPVLQEEVIVGKREVQDVARVSGDVRREELRVDDPGTPRRSATAEEIATDVRRRG